MKYLTLDIETIPHQNLPEGCTPQFDPNTVKYGNTKDEGKRAAKYTQAKQAFDGKINKRMSLDPALCQVCTFVGMTFNAERVSLQMDGEADDYEIVVEAWESIRDAYMSRTPIVTFNGIEFDLPILRFRAMALDIPVDPVMFEKLTYRYAFPHHYDLMARLNRYKVEAGKNLDFYLRLFEIGSKGDFDASMVYEAWQNGEYEKIQRYCEEDVRKTAELFERVEPWIKVERKK